MAQDLSLWNASALRLLQSILGAAAPFRFELHGAEIDISLQESGGGSWPEPPPLSLKPSEHGAWPDTLVARAEWPGGSTSFRLAVICTGKRYGTRARYDGLVALVVDTRTGHHLIWLNVPTAIAKDERDEVELCVLTAIVKRQDNSEPRLDERSLCEFVRTQSRSIQADDARAWCEQAAMELGTRDDGVRWLSEEIDRASST